MAELYPPLPAELVTFAHGGVSLLVGTCSAKHVPECVRGMGLRVWADACRLTVMLPAATSAISVANLRENPKLAVTASHIPSHRTMQLKGEVTGIREGTPEDRAFAEHYRKLFSEDLAWIGQPAGNTLRLALWPLFAVDVKVAVVYVQTPGPSAGVKLADTKGLL